MLSNQELFDYMILPAAVAIIQAAAMFTAFYLGKHSGREAAEIKQNRRRQGPASPHRETGRRFTSKPPLQHASDQPDIMSGEQTNPASILIQHA